jgi:uncharacterized protein (DUF488 family)
MAAAEALNVLNRQKTILFMLKQAGGSASRLLLTKWAFLLAQETPSHGGDTFYQFVPYHYGPYSFSLAREISALVRDGFIIEPNGNTWNLTHDGVQTVHALPVAIERDAADVMRKYGNISLEPLLASIYARYPWFTVNSKEEHKRAQARPVATPAVHTLGYEGLMVDGFLDRLVRSGIQCLVDVRNNPVSRRYGFHKSTLLRLCTYLGIEYRHFPELGVPAESRTCLDVPSDYQALFDRYRRDMLPRQAATVQKAAEILVTRPSVLVCMEADPECCHRSHLATALAKLTGLPIKHLATPR